MTRPRRARGRRLPCLSATPRSVLVLGCAAATVVASVIVGVIAAGSRADAPAAGAAVHAALDGRGMGRQLPGAAAVRSVSVEVPDVTGMTIGEAEVVLRAAGLVLTGAATDRSRQARPDARVGSQDPVAGALVRAGSSVRVTLERRMSGSTTRSAPVGRWTVCIDPVHQGRGDQAPEPIAPGSAESRARMTSGATGVRTGIPECEITLQIATNLKERLEAAGVRVVMTRTTNDIDVSNAERARIANRARADLFVRIDAEGHPEEDLAGVRTLYPAASRWTRSITSASRRAAREVHARVRARTGALDRGVHARSDLAGFNFSRVPVVLVECGLLSNPVEDRLLASPHYQDKLASGIAEGVLGYLRGSSR